MNIINAFIYSKRIKIKSYHGIRKKQSMCVLMRLHTECKICLNFKVFYKFSYIFLKKRNHSYVVFYNIAFVLPLLPMFKYTFQVR